MTNSPLTELLANRAVMVNRLKWLAWLILAHVVALILCMDSGHTRVALIPGVFIPFAVAALHLGLAALEQVDEYLDGIGVSRRQVLEGSA